MGPIAKQWEGEVVLPGDGMLPLADISQPTSPSPRKRGSPPSPPAMTRAERASDAMGKGDRREGKRMASDCYACAGFHGGDIELSVGYG